MWAGGGLQGAGEQGRLQTAPKLASKGLRGLGFGKYRGHSARGPQTCVSEFTHRSCNKGIQLWESEEPGAGWVLYGEWGIPRLSGCTQRNATSNCVTISDSQQIVPTH